MEKEVQVKGLKEIKDFSFGEGKTGYNITVNTIDDQELRLTTFSKTTRDEVEGLAFVADTTTFKIKYTEKPNKNPDYPPTRTITAYTDSEGVYKETAKKGSGGGGYARNAKDSESIERQVALKEASAILQRNAEFTKKAITEADVIGMATSFSNWFKLKGEKNEADK